MAGITQILITHIIGMIGFEDYTRVKHRYCICYFGPIESYVVQLGLLAPILEQKFPGLIVGIGCRNTHIHWLGNATRAVPLTEIKLRRQEYAYVRELTSNNCSHPILDFIEECNLDNCYIQASPIETTKCVIITRGDLGIRCLTESEVAKLSHMARDRGYEPDIDGDWRDAGLVIGPESASVFAAAGAGSKTILIDSGLGTPLYKRMFPNNEVGYT